MHPFSIAQVKTKKIDYDIPLGYTALSPVLSVENVERCAIFIRKVFRARVVEAHYEGEKLVVADLQVADTIIGVTRPLKNFPLTEFVLCLFVPNAQRTYERALRCGAVKVEGKNLAVTDLDGNTWIIREYQDPGKSWRKKLGQALVGIKNRLSYTWARRVNRGIA